MSSARVDAARPARVGLRNRAACTGTTDMNLAIVEPADKRALHYILREGRVSISPALAERILAEANYARQRRVYGHHVALLADAMRRNRWTAGSQIAFGWLGGRLHLVNGQHRMHAIIAAQRTIEVQVLIEAVDTEAELAALYYRFDVQQRRRSTSEVLNAAEIAQQHGLSAGMTKAAFEAVALIGNGLKPINYQQEPVKARSVDARLDAARAWWPTAGLFQQAIKRADTTLKAKLLSTGVVAVGLVTLRYQPEKAEAFWRGVAADDGLRVGDPRRTLIKDLMGRRLNVGRQAQAVIVSALAWNAFFLGKPLKILKVYEGADPKVLGTPFDGSRK